MLENMGACPGEGLCSNNLQKETGLLYMQHTNVHVI